MIETFHIALAMKPIDGNFAKNALEHGIAGLNVDACRVPSDDSQLEEKYYSVRNAGHRGNIVYGDEARPRCEGNIQAHSQGRFPANLLHDGSNDVTMHFPYSTTGRLSSEMNITENTGWNGKSYRNRIKNDFRASSGSAARFFFSTNDDCG